MSKDNSSWITRRKLPKKVADLIEEEACKIPYYLLKDCTFPEEIIERDGLDRNPYFSHTLSEGTSRSEYYRKFPINFITDFALMKGREMMRSHITFHSPRLEKFGQHHHAHVDNLVKKHDVILYYVNDADGDTFFFEATHPCESEDDKRKVIHRETPEKGKMVIFNGNRFHASSPPTNNFRMTLNINYERT